MGIFIFVNIVISTVILLAGSEMRKKRARSYGKKNLVGFKSKRAMASEEAWLFANSKCGMMWMFIGATAYLLTITAYIRYHFTVFGAVMQVLLLIIMIAGAVLSVKFVEAKLKDKFDEFK